ncbi:hypothetical protein ACWGI0_05875 [Streptomyces sp. NPDC054802]
MDPSEAQPPGPAWSDRRGESGDDRVVTDVAPDRPERPRLYDCFLYSDQSPYRELLELRIALLRQVVDQFVIVCSRQTFSGRKLPSAFPHLNAVVGASRDRISLVVLDELHGAVPREREAYARNALARALDGASDDDLVMVSDIDELPRPEVLDRLVADPPSAAVLLGLDYYNFKFNYRLAHGVQAPWAGPVVTPFSRLGRPNDLRQSRWSLFHDPDRVITDAGWHFSFLTAADHVRTKLDTMFSPQEREWRGFPDGVRSDWRGSVAALVRDRRGFHDHMYAGSVWAQIDLSDLRCESLEQLVACRPEYVLDGNRDDQLEVRRRVSLAMWRLYEEEIPKVLYNATARQLRDEVMSRLRRHLRRVLTKWNH